MTTLGRDADGDAASLPLGHHRARDGTTGGAVRLDTDRPHAAVVVGKRGSGKSHTLGVLAEGLAEAPGVTPVVVDTLGEFGGLSDPVAPRVRAGDLPARAWPTLVGLDPTTPAGAVVWETVADADGLAAAVASLSAAEGAVDPGVRRVAAVHLRRATRWGVFGDGGLRPADLLTDGDPVVVDCAGLPDPATDAVCRVLARGCYEACLADEPDRLPWLLVDEAHVRFDGVAGPALDRLYTRGRTPGVSVVCATQRPSALPETAVTQADLLVAHALTGSSDRERLAATRPSYLAGGVGERLPEERGVALVVDDTREAAHTVTVRERWTPHGGTSPRATTVAERRDGSETEE
ncbi:ATP-binding protein [Halobaculum sp. MBLA0143]|uniref:ATP-binding protein n=1 Tax=Halobaculum sp. MBLA0143 TaxID=3079933 RepID=UPI003524938E